MNASSLKTILLLGVTGITVTAHADYVSSLGDSLKGDSGVLDISSSPTSWVAASFTTGTNAASFPLMSVALHLNPAEGEGSAGTFAVSIYAADGNGGAPGTLVKQLVGENPVSSDAGDFSFTAPSDMPELQAATTYWVTATVTDASMVYKWVYGAGAWNGETDMPEMGWAINDAYAFNDGSGWVASAGNPLLFSVTVPEPGVLSLAVLGGVGMLLRRRVRR